MRLGKILKDKNKRDSALLGFMILIILAFILYIFLPGGRPGGGAGLGKMMGSSGGAIASDSAPRKTPVSVQRRSEVANPEHAPGAVSPAGAEDSLASRIENLALINEQFGQCLAAVYRDQAETGLTFTGIPAQELRRLLALLENPLIDRLLKFNFFDLNAIPSGDFPQEYIHIGPLRFNIFTALFLIKISEENIAARMAEFSFTELIPLVELDCYRLLNQEILENHQLLPLLFYFKILAQRLPVYPNTDPAAFFKGKLAGLRDLTPDKYLTALRESLRFSESTGRFRLRWRESDGLTGDDVREYGNLKFTVFCFLGQHYLLFPDLREAANNQWLRELASADSGDIELSEFDIASEDIAAPLQLRRMLYNPMESRFIVVFREKDPVIAPGDSYLDKILKQRISLWNENYIMLEFTWRPGSKEDKKLFEKNLEVLGNHMKKVSELYQGN